MLNDREARFSQPKLELYGLYRSLRVLKLYLIGVQNLIVKVDAKYIKGMLSNPDIAPSASINRWIVSILMFHFELVHVPGACHGPDGLSRRRPQEGDTSDNTDDFEDWIDEVNGFPHMILSTSPRKVEQPPVTMYLLHSFVNSDVPGDATADTVEPTQGENEQSYAIVPRSDLAQKADERVERVKEWHATLTRPDNLKDSEYETFIRYSTEFFVSKGRLWRKDRLGEHKLVITQERRLFIMYTAHDDTGHHGFFATNSLITLRYWWPFMGSVAMTSA